MEHFENNSVDTTAGGNPLREGRNREPVLRTDSIYFEQNGVYRSYRFNAFTAGTIVGVQTRVFIKRVVVDIGGATDTRILLYDNYYQAVNLKKTINGHLEGPIELDTEFTQGIFLVVTGTVSAPEFTIYTDR